MVTDHPLSIAVAINIGTDPENRGGIEGVLLGRPGLLAA